MEIFRQLASLGRKKSNKFDPLVPQFTGLSFVFTLGGLTGNIFGNSLGNIIR